MFRCAI
jgi:hypothetical protein